MDRFNIEIDEDEREGIERALRAMIRLTAMVARHYHVCPTCLTYVFADAISRAEEAGEIGHGLSENEPEEEETVQ